MRAEEKQDTFHKLLFLSSEPPATNVSPQPRLPTVSPAPCCLRSPTSVQWKWVRLGFLDAYSIFFLQVWSTFNSLPISSSQNGFDQPIETDIFSISFEQADYVQQLVCPPSTKTSAFGTEYGSVAEYWPSMKKATHKNSPT